MTTEGLYVHGAVSGLVFNSRQHPLGNVGERGEIDISLQELFNLLLISY